MATHVSSYRGNKIHSVMDPVTTQCDDSSIKVEVKEEPDYVYIDESVCRVKLEEKDGDLVLPKEEETEKIVADVGLYGSQPSSLELQSSHTRGRRHRILRMHKPESSTSGAARKILPRPQMQVPSLKITHTPLPISPLQPASQPPSKQLPDSLPEQQSSLTQNVVQKKPPSPQVAANTTGTGRKILPRPHLPTPLVHSQQQPVPIQQLQSINTSTAHQTIPLSQLHSISPANNCNIMPIHQLQSTLPGTSHTTLSVPQLKSSLGAHTQRAVPISPKKSVVAAVAKKPIPLSPLKSSSLSTGVTPTPHLQTTPPDATKKIGHIQQKQSASPGNGRKLLPWPQQPSIRPSGMIIHPQQQSISLQHLQTVSPSSNHQTVPLQQVQSIPVSSSQQALPIHQLQKICPVSAPQNISLQQIQTLNAVNSQQNMSLQPLHNTPSVSTQQSLPLQPLQALTSVSSHQTVPVQQLQAMPSGNSHQTMPAQQLQTVPSGSSQQTMPVQQVQAIPTGNSQPVQHLQTIPSGSSQQVIPVHQVQTIQSASSQQTLPVHQVQTIPSGSSHQSMPVQQLQSITSGNSQQTIPVQHLQAVPSGSSHQYMPIQQLQSIQSVSTGQATTVHHVQAIAPTSTSQTMPLHQLHTIAPATQHQTIPLQPLQTIQSTCPQQGIPFQQLQSITPATTQILPIHQYNNSHSHVPLQQIQTIPHASNQQTVPLQQLGPVTPGISQHSVSMQQLQSIPQTDGHQTLSVQQLQPISQGNTQSNHPLQHLKPLPSTSMQQAPVHCMQSITSTASQMSMQQLHPMRLNNSSQCMQVQPIASPSQNQTAVHLQQHIQPVASSDVHQGTSLHKMHCTTQRKAQLKVPIHPIKTINPVARNNLKPLRQHIVTGSTSKTGSILNVGSVTSYTKEKNIKTKEKKLPISDTSDKAVPIVPGRKILPRPLLLTTPTNFDCQTVQLEKLRPITSTTNCTILPKHQIKSETSDNVCKTIVIPPEKSSVDVSLHSALSIPELWSATSSFSHKTIPIEQLQPLISHQAVTTVTDCKSLAIQLPLSSTTVANSFVPSSEQSFDTVESNDSVVSSIQSSGKLVSSSKQEHPAVSPKGETVSDMQVITGNQHQSLPPPESPTQETVGVLSPVFEQDTSLSDTACEKVSSPQEETSAINDCTDIVSTSQLMMVTTKILDVTKHTLHHPGTMSTSKELVDSSRQNCDKMLVNIVSKPQIQLHSPSASSEPSFDSQGNYDVSHFRSKSLPASPEDFSCEVISEKYLPTVREQIRSFSTPGSLHTNEHEFNISTSNHFHSQDYVSPARTDESPSDHEDQNGILTVKKPGSILQETSENETTDRSLNNSHLKVGASHASDEMKTVPEQQFNISESTSDDTFTVMQQQSHSLDASTKLSSAHSQHFSSAVQVMSHSQPIYNAVGITGESLPTQSEGYSSPCSTEESQPSFQQGYTILESTEVSVQTQPMQSPLFYSNANTPLTYASTTELKPELEVEYAANNATEGAVSNHELQYTVPCTASQILPFDPPQNETANNKYVADEQEQCSPCSANVAVPVSHLEVSSASDHDDLTFHRITSSTFSASCSCVPAAVLQQSVTQVNHKGCWVNTQTLHQAKVLEPLDFNHPQVSTKNENIEVKEEDPDVPDSHQLQDSLQECPDYLKEQEEPVEETSCLGVLGQKCSQTCLQSQGDHHSLSKHKRCQSRKRSRALAELCKLKVIVMSQKNTIRTLWKKLKFERRKNKKLHEKLIKSRNIKIEETFDYKDSNCGGVEERHSLDTLKEVTSVSMNSGVCTGSSVKSSKRKCEEKTSKITKRQNTSDYNITGIDSEGTLHSLNGTNSSLNVGSELQCLIQEFMMRDDISQLSKKTTIDGESNSVRYRLHYLPVLHKRFMADCCKYCSFQTFCKYIPCNVMKCKADELDSCLCMTCQNPELKIVSMVKRRFLSMNTDIEEIINNEEAFELFIKNLKSLKSRNALLTYTTWSVAISGNRPPVPMKRTLTRSLGEVISSLESELCSLRDHLKRTYQQYEATYKAKFEAKSSCYHAVIQTDWSPLIILHSVSENGVPEPQRVVSLQCGYMWSLLDSSGFIALSDSKDRTASAVCASLEKVFNRLIKKGMKTLTFIVDPQIHIAGVREYAQRHDIEVSWIYVEPGHGCGMAEAVGNSISQLICDTINTNGVSVIRTAKDVFNLIGPNSNNFVYFYTDDDVCRQREQVNSDNIPKNGNKFIKPKMLVPLHISNP
ncbi:uncharacterized protein [Panulirus ornatus]|uniref:uncharacterized protein isoform X2 n=1 Tax=Panulirus ornatus TaxID=150431 RepID=UPI003A844D61